MDEPDLHMLIVSGGIQTTQNGSSRLASSHLPRSLLTHRTQAPSPEVFRPSVLNKAQTQEPHSHP